MNPIVHEKQRRLQIKKKFMENCLSEKIRVIHIITRLDKGGSAETTLQTVSFLNHEKYEVFLCHGLSQESNMGNVEKEAVEWDLSLAEAKGVRVFAVPSLVRRLSIKNDLLAFISIYRLIKRINPHIVHTHTSKAGFLGRLAAFFNRAPIVIHTPHGHVFHSYYGLIMSKMFVIAEKILSQITDKISTLTVRERDEHLKNGIATIEKYVIIHSGVMLDRIMNMNVDVEAGKRKYGIPQDSNVIGVVGRLVSVKGHKYLVSASKRIINEFHNTFFLFVGDGYLKSRLEKQAGTLGVDKNIIFTGWLNNVTEIMTLFDILVLPSLNEGMGRVLIEGMALGKPIVASSVGGVGDVIKDGENGILIPPGDSHALEQAILKLIRNKSLAQELGKNGKSKVYPEYDTFVMVRQINDLYQNMLNRKRLQQSLGKQIKA